MKYLISINQIPIIEKPGSDFPWKEYMARFVTEEVDAIELLNRIGKGFGFGPVFGGDGYPRKENFYCAQHVVVDMDTEDERSSLAVLERHPLVAAHGAIIYPTHSHTPERPRHRVVFLLNAPIYQVEHYRTICATVTAFFAGADPAGGSNPVMTWQANGRIDADNLWPLVYLAPEFDFGIEDVALYTARHRRVQEKQDASRRQEPRSFEEQDRMPLAELFGKLNRIDPYSMGYTDWVKLGAAIAHSYGDDAFHQFKAWSDKPGKVPLTVAKWRSFIRATGNQAGYGTIVMFLKGRAIA